MKYYKEFCKILGIEPNKEYTLKDTGKNIIVDENGLRWRYNFGDLEECEWELDYWADYDWSFVHGLINGDLEVEEWK